MSVELNDITSGYSTGLINDNFQLVKDELNNNVLRRDGLSLGEANHMEVGLDMNSNFVYNLPEPVLEHQAARLQDVQNAIADNTANLITFTPYKNIASGNVQAAIQEVVDEAGELEVTTATGAETIVAALNDRVAKSLLEADNGELGIGDPPSPTNMLYVKHETDLNPGKGSSVQIQRWSNNDEGFVNPKALRVLTTVAAGATTQTEWAISGEIEVNTDSSAAGHAAVSGVGIKNAKGQTFGSHFQVKDTTELISSTGGSIIGQELNIQANGVDDGLSRVGYDVIARTYKPGWDNGAPAGEFHAAVRIRNSNQNASGGKWIHGLLVEDGVQTITRAITTKNSPGATTGWALQDEGAKANGVRLTGDYGNAAIDLSQQDITNNDIAIKLKSNAKIEFNTGVSIDWASDIANPSLRLRGQNTQTTVGAAGVGAALPSNPKGYIKLAINGSEVVIPFYNQA